MPDTTSDWKKVRKKPVVVEALRVCEENRAALEALHDPSAFDLFADKERCSAFVYNHGGDGHKRIASVEIKVLGRGQAYAYPGDYVIRGVNGELYPCKPDIFEATYEPA